MSSVEWPSFEIERTAVRILLCDLADRVLLLRVRDTQRVDLEPWWELPGGGIEPGEGPGDAAARELAEETGIAIAATEFPKPSWYRDCTYRYRGRRIFQHESIVVVHLGTPTPELSGAARTAAELEDVIGHRWWTITEVQDSRERFFPGRLPTLIAEAVAGRRIDEPFEYWD